MLPLNHLPALFIASTQTFGGMVSFFNPKWCIEAYGLPQYISASNPAQTIMVVSSARQSAFGIAMFTFHSQEQYAAVDLMMMTLGLYVGAADAYIAWTENQPRRIVSRLLAGAMVAVGGWWGGHEWV